MIIKCKARDSECNRAWHHSRRSSVNFSSREASSPAGTKRSRSIQTNLGSGAYSRYRICCGSRHSNHSPYCCGSVDTPGTCNHRRGCCKHRRCCRRRSNSYRKDYARPAGGAACDCACRGNNGNPPLQMSHSADTQSTCTPGARHI